MSIEEENSLCVVVGSKYSIGKILKPYGLVPSDIITIDPRTGTIYYCDPECKNAFDRKAVENFIQETEAIIREVKSRAKDKRVERNKIIYRI
jgi:hypothetical protein